MSILLLILSLIGAIPDVIAAVKEIWDLIKKIFDRQTRLVYRKKLLAVIEDAIDKKTGKLAAAKCLVDLCALRCDVLAVLSAQATEAFSVAQKAACVPDAG